MPKNRYHTDHVLYHHAMQLEFNDEKNFPLPLTSSYSIMEADTRNKAQGGWGNIEAGGRLGDLMFLKTGEHTCALLFKT